MGALALGGGGLGGGGGGEGGEVGPIRTSQECTMLLSSQKERQR